MLSISTFLALAVLLGCVSSTFGAQCPEQKCYLIHQISRNRADAQQNCKNLGGRLASITDAETNEYVARLMSWAFDWNPTYTRSNGAWIGATTPDAGKSNQQWTWESCTGAPGFESVKGQGSPNSDVYTNWPSGYPSSTSVEGCLMMSDDGTWNDWGCTSVKFSVCEIPCI